MKIERERARGRGKKKKQKREYTELGVISGRHRNQRRSLLTGVKECFLGWGVEVRVRDDWRGGRQKMERN